MSIEGTAQTEYASLSGKIHTFVVDKTLSISGACADAQVVGKEIERLDNVVPEAKEAYEEAKGAYDEAVGGMEEAARTVATEVSKEEVGKLKAGDVGAYSKEEVLTTDTKTAFGLGADAVPNDAFSKIAGDLAKVGDIKHTTRTDLGDNWLLCNGAIVDRAVTPDLWLKAGFGSEGGTTVSTGVYQIGHGDENENFVVIPYITSNSNYYLQVMVYNKNDNTTTVVQILPQGNSNLNDTIVKYVNGKWVLVYRYTNQNYIYIYSTDDPTGTWSNVATISTGSSSRAILDMFYHEGQYYLFSNYQGTVYVDHTSNLSGNWSSTSFTLEGGNTPGDIAYHDGTFAITAGITGVHVSESPLGPYTQAFYQPSYVCDKIECKDGVWVLFARSNGSSPTYFYTFTLPDLYGEYTLNKLEVGRTVASLKTCMSDAAFYVSSNNGCVFASSDGYNWSFVKVIDTSGSSYSDVSPCNGDALMLWKNSSIGQLYRIGRALPVISVDNAYAYIKAKEDD